MVGLHLAAAVVPGVQPRRVARRHRLRRAHRRRQRLQGVARRVLAVAQLVERRHQHLRHVRRQRLARLAGRSRLNHDRLFRITLLRVGSRSTGGKKQGEYHCKPGKMLV